MAEGRNQQHRAAGVREVRRAHQALLRAVDRLDKIDPRTGWEDEVFRLSLEVARLADGIEGIEPVDLGPEDEAVTL